MDLNPPFKAVNSHYRFSYRPWLDGIRGLAILCVFVFHINHMVFKDGPMLGRYLGLPQGYLGVDIFFVLSGFLITTLLLEEWSKNESISLRRFYIRRALRLFPALFSFLAVMAGLAYATLPPTDAKPVYGTIGYALFYCTNWASALQLAPVSEMLAHTWSLSIEEQFYLLWPCLLLGLLRLRVNRFLILALVVVAIAAVLAHRVSLVWSGVPTVRVYGATDTRADSLLIGCVVAMVTTWHLSSRRAFRFALGLLAFASVLLIEFYLTAHMPGSLFTLGMTVFALAVGTILLYLMVSPSPIVLRLLQSRPLVWVGKLSYSLYLWHIFAVVLALRCGFASRHLTAAASVVVALSISAASYYLIERPFLRLKARYAEDIKVLRLNPAVSNTMNICET